MLAGWLEGWTWTAELYNVHYYSARSVRHQLQEVPETESLVSVLDRRVCWAGNADSNTYVTLRGQDSSY